MNKRDLLSIGFAVGAAAITQFMQRRESDAKNTRDRDAERAADRAAMTDAVKSAVVHEVSHNGKVRKLSQNLEAAKDTINILQKQKPKKGRDIVTAGVLGTGGSLIALSLIGEHAPWLLPLLQQLCAGIPS